ncbi:MAG: DNA repair protein RecN [Gammaproteobacteria bacterium]|nr:DNA repair protein RecN [Gammaproteobacteria bacterium]
MLTHVQIRDFAIIDAVELELKGGLSALTGETGAGKSIVVDAVMLAVGARATADVVRHGAERAEITATFDIRDNAAALAWLEANDLGHEGEVMLRRVVGADGRSRLYVNGQAQPAQAVRELGELLIDIHGQQEFLSLTRRAAQRALLDEHGGHAALLAPVAVAAREWKTLVAERDALAAAAADRGSRLELLRYQVSELEALALAAGEVESLIDEQSRLSNRGRLAEAARGALALVYDGDGADAHAQASRALAHLRSAAGLDSTLAPAAEVLQEALIGLKEAGSQLGGYLESLEVDPDRQEFVERRIAALEDLARKHRVRPVELPETLATLSATLASLEQAEVSLASLEARIDAARSAWGTASARLSTARRKAGKTLAQAITELMGVLGMPGGRFEVAVTPAPAEQPSAEGADTIEFLVSANPGQPPRPVAKVASGGELSRISLAVQVAAASAEPHTCMIFDEVDAGVGGAVAEVVGRQLRALGERGQVLCVTHLPQVASQAHHQLRVAKLTDGRSSRTTIAELAQGERVEELARMLGGLEITQKARDHAREMLKVSARPRGGKAAAE